MNLLAALVAFVQLARAFVRAFRLLAFETALQDFSAPGAVLVTLPRDAVDRLQGCLPAIAAE